MNKGSMIFQICQDSSRSIRDRQRKISKILKLKTKDNRITQLMTFLINYLEPQSKRFGKKFDFNINKLLKAKLDSLLRSDTIQSFYNFCKLSLLKMDNDEKSESSRYHHDFSDYSLSPSIVFNDYSHFLTPTYPKNYIVNFNKSSYQSFTPIYEKRHDRINKPIKPLDSFREQEEEESMENSKENNENKPKNIKDNKKLQISKKNKEKSASHNRIYFEKWLHSSEQEKTFLYLKLMRKLNSSVKNIVNSTNYEVLSYFREYLKNESKNSTEEELKQSKFLNQIFRFSSKALSSNKLLILEFHSFCFRHNCRFMFQNGVEKVLEKNTFLSKQNREMIEDLMIKKSSKTQKDTKIVFQCQRVLVQLGDLKNKILSFNNLIEYLMHCNHHSLIPQQQQLHKHIKIGICGSKKGKFSIKIIQEIRLILLQYQKLFERN